MELAVERVYAQSRGASRRRAVVFRVLAIIFFLIGLFMLEGLTEGLMPWKTLGCPGCTEATHPELHRWHGAMHGSLIAILLSGSMLMLAIKPAGRELLLQFYVLGFATLWIVFGAFIYQDFTDLNYSASISFLIALTLIVSAYPYWRRVFSFERSVPLSLPLLGLTILSGLVLAPQIWEALQNQIDGSAADEHAVGGRWAESAAIMAVLIVGGLLASTRRPGWLVLGTLLGIAYVFLGVAAITVPDQPGSWGTVGGVLSIIGGATYLGLSYRESRVAAAVAPLPEPEPVLAT